MRISLLAAATLVCACVAAHADPVTYTLTGTFSGTIGPVSFADDPGTIKLVSDTSGIVDQGGGFFTNTQGTGTIMLGGIGTATFLNSTFGAYSASYAAGFVDTASGFGADDYDPLNPAMASYALTAPFTDTGFLLFSSAPETTSLGDLTITGDFASAVTFTAAGATVTPEPSTLLGVATGLLGISGVLRRRSFGHRSGERG